MPVLTEEQLSGRSPDQLVATILQIQTQHQQYAAHLALQYDSISQQLAELRASLQAFYGGQAAAHQAASAVCSILNSLIPVPIFYMHPVKELWPPLQEQSG